MDGWMDGWMEERERERLAFYLFIPAALSLCPGEDKM